MAPSIAARAWAASNFHGKRDDSSTSPSQVKGVIILSVILGVLLCLSLALYYVLRHLRSKRVEPKYLPSTWLKNKWRAWTPSSERKRYSSSLQTPRESQLFTAPSTTSLQRTLPSESGYELSATDTTTGGASTADQNQSEVDRRTSVRSIMTLPAYVSSPRPGEQVLGREGERGGIDTVVEFPETAEEEEARRDEEMEALYNIRQVRRREREEREERRRLRQAARDARAAGDPATYDRIRRELLLAESPLAAGAVLQPSDALIDEHRARERGRRISSVSYADLGIARHDGSRVRGDSRGSDHCPLLNSAASFGGQSRDQSPFNPPQRHLREFSTSSLNVAATPDESDDDGRSSGEFEVPPTSGRRSSASVSRALDSHPDAPDTQNTDPPRYDDLGVGGPHPNEHQIQAEPAIEGDAPAYEEPTDAPRLPAIAPLPAIEVTSPVIDDHDEPRHF